MFNVFAAVMIIGQVGMVFFAPDWKSRFLAGLFAVANYVIFYVD
jgi:hypothetical protein